MAGFELWVVLAAVSSLGVLAFTGVRLRARGWMYRILMTMGFLCLIWGAFPVLGGGKIQQFLVVGAIVAFGFLVLSESTGDGSRW